MEQSHSDFFNIMKKNGDMKISNICAEMRKLGYQDFDENWIRLIKGEVTDMGLLLGSTPKRGYFLIRTDKDLEDTIRDWRSRAKTLLRRSANMKRLYFEKKVGQQKIF